MTLLLTAAPVSRAAIDSDLYDSLLKKCYRNSDDNDADDLYAIIKKALEGHTDQGLELVEKLIDKLKDNRKKKLDKDVSEKDLEAVEKKLKKWLRKHRTQVNGNINTPESATVAP